MKFLKAVALAAVFTTSTGQAQEMKMTENTQVTSTIDRMTSAFAAGDVEAIMSTYAPGAVVVGEPGKQMSGDATLRAMFAAFIKSGVAFSYGAHEVVVAGDTALHLMKWTAPGPDGKKMNSLSVAVLKRQPDGNWRMVIDHPFGDGVMHVQ